MNLVEREALLRQLQDDLHDAASAGGRIVLLAGEAGAGKTSLLQAFAETRGDAALWWGGCDALQTPHPLAPLQDVARGSGAAFGRHLAQGADRVALFEAVLAGLACVPVLFVIEDTHWADAATLDLLKFLGRRIDRVPCLLVVSYRDDELGAAHPLRGLMGELSPASCRHLDVPRLSPAGVETLARRALRSAAGIHAATQGNAFFVTELLRHGSEGVPRGVQGLVLARYARLSPAARDIVQLASTVPAKIERWLVERILAPTVVALEECLACGLLLADGSTLAFRHELARSAVESSLPAPVAEAWHARVLAELERSAAPATLARLAHHAAHARDGASVLRLAPRAGEEASRRGAHKEAATHLRHALEHAQELAPVPHAELLDRLAYECYLTECMDEAIAAREASLPLWRAAGDALKAGDNLRWLSRLHWYNGKGSPAVRHADAAIATLQALPPGRELAMAYSNRAQLHMLAGECAAACAWGEQALALARTLGDVEIEIHALNNMGAARFTTGDLAGRAELERSLALALEHGCEEHAARAYTNLGYDTGVHGDLAGADAWLEQGIAYCEAHDLDSWTRYMGAYRAEVALWLGDWALATERSNHLLRQPRLAPISRMLALVVQGRLRARRGEADARAPLDEALALALPTAEFMRIGPVAAARAEAAWLRGEPQAIAAEVDTALLHLAGAAHLAQVAGELAYWRHRAGLPGGVDAGSGPFALQIAGRWREAADAWAARGCRYESARALAEGDAVARIEALACFEELGARVDAERLRKALHVAGVRGLPRGLRAATQANPHQLTEREAEVLHLLCTGLRNAEIAQRLHRSVRTVDHHLAAIFAKLGVASRAEAISVAVRTEK